MKLLSWKNSRPEVLNRIRSISGRAPELHDFDIRDSDAVAKVLGRSGAKAVLHFAGLKAVGESVQDPVAYYSNNVAGSIALCQAMQREGEKHMVFSSSATVYGEPDHVPISEEAPLRPQNLGVPFPQAEDVYVQALLSKLDGF